MVSTKSRVLLSFSGDLILIEKDGCIYYEDISGRCKLDRGEFFLSFGVNGYLKYRLLWRMIELGEYHDLGPV